MSRNERKRMTIMAGVKSGELTQVRAGELMGLGYRQAKRVWRRYQDAGDAGLGHRLRTIRGGGRHYEPGRRRGLSWGTPVGLPQLKPGKPTNNSNQQKGDILS